MPAKNKPNELFLTRTYDASLKQVWDAWNDPKQAAKWWGPRGFTITHISKDLKPGGTWRYTMHGPDGKDYPNVTKYLEVEPYKRLVYDHGGTDDTPPLFKVTVNFSENFSENNKKTKIEMTMGFATEEVAKNMKKFIKDAGGNGTWDRLAEYLAKESANKEVFVMNESFNAPLELMFQLWTDPKHFSKWLPPTGMTMEFINADVKPGGKIFYKMTNGADVTMYGQIEYVEITKPNRLVYIQDFRTEDGKISRHPLAPTWPEAMRTTVTFSEEGPEQTRVTIQWEPFGAANSEELATFVAAKPGMTQGWGGSFAKLEKYLPENI